MYANRGAERVRQEIIRLCHTGLDARTLRIKVFDQLQHVVPFDAFWCATTDPATFLFTGAIIGGCDPQLVPEYLNNEFLQDDFNKFSDLAKIRQSVATLQMATRGDPKRSARYREILEPNGLGHEMRGVFRSGNAAWGAMCLHRKTRNQGFTTTDVAFLATITSHLTAGLRTALLLNAVEITPASNGPGLLLLSNDLTIIAMTPGVEQLLADFNDWPHSHALPQAVYAVVAKLRALEREPLETESVGTASAAMPRTRLKTRSDRWLTLYASRLTNPSLADQIAVIIESATPDDIAPLVLQAHALTTRELEVAALVLKGRSTEDIATQLSISTLTVQQHLKAIFDKMDVRSRRELVARIFTQSYWPSFARDHGLTADHWPST